MGGIAKFFSDVEGLLRVGYPKLQRGFGAAALDAQSSPPRIVWVIVGVVHVPAEKIGRPRSLLTRRVDIAAHVWGSSLEELESLVEDTIAAVHNLAHGSVVFNGEEWITDDLAHRGMAALLRMRVEGPVFERRFKVGDRDADTAKTRATVTQIDADPAGAVPGDGSIEWKES